jgi:hypothetical protein
MRDAHKGVSVAALPSGTWRATPLPPALPPGLDMLQSLLPGAPSRQPIPVPVANARTQMPAESGSMSAPMSLDRAADVASRYPLPPASIPTSRGRDALLPPEDVPGGEVSPGYPPRERNFFDKLFGG